MMTQPPHLLSRTALHLINSGPEDEAAARALGFGAVVVGDEVPASSASTMTHFLAVDAARCRLEQLPLAHMLGAADEDPLVGVRLEDDVATDAQRWQLSPELTLEPLAQVSVGPDAPPMANAGLVPAGFVAQRLTGDGALHPEKLRALLSEPHSEALTGLQAYPVAQFAPGQTYAKARKAVFLDRDGIINVDSGYGHRPEDFAWVKGVVEFLRAMQDEGWSLVILTNQAGVAKGKFDWQTATGYHDYIVQQLAGAGIEILASELCPFHAEGSVARYRQPSILRKPQPGMALRLASRGHLALDRSVMIGDKDSDRLRLPGLRPYILQGRYELKQPAYTSFADIRAALQHDRTHQGKDMP